MRRGTIIRAIAATMLALMACHTVAAQENAGDGVGRHEGEDSLVWLLPYEEMVPMRLGALMADTLLERTQIGLMVWDLDTDQPIFQHGARQVMRTASTKKLITAITALDLLHSDYRIYTSIYYKGEPKATFDGDIVCRGAMDPLLGSDDLKAFARAIYAKGVRKLTGRLVCDMTMKEPAKWGEGWCWDDDNPELSPLLVDGKPTFAARLLRAMKSEGIDVAEARTTEGIVTRDCTLLCERSHTLSEVLVPMMKDSDNLMAEAVYYQVAAASGHRPATAGDARRAEQALIKRVGLTPTDYRLADGSGLSLYNYVSPELQVALLRYAWRNEAIRNALLPVLPIAGTDGTLKNRMKDTAAAGNVRAKTGTVTAVSALAGYLTAPNGHTLAFSIVNQGLRKAAEGRALQDRICQALCEK